MKKERKVLSERRVQCIVTEVCTMSLGMGWRGAVRASPQDCSLGGSQLCLPACPQQLSAGSSSQGKIQPPLHIIFP